MGEVICDRCGAIGLNKKAKTSKNGEMCRVFEESELGGIVKRTVEHRWVEA